MKTVECKNCGAKELSEEDGYLRCLHCQSRFYIKPVATIGVVSDVEDLLRKCEEDPANRRRYANRVLDMDPTNARAHRYLSKGEQ